MTTLSCTLIDTGGHIDRLSFGIEEEVNGSDHTHRLTHSQNVKNNRRFGVAKGIRGYFQGKEDI